MFITSLFKVDLTYQVPLRDLLQMLANLPLASYVHDTNLIQVIYFVKSLRAIFLIPEPGHRKEMNA
jgi:hypothetical protein